tara:strand:+ start:105 stop:632 length:528 start_codon:yes stop_codon:yes gene_type:complete
MSSTLKVDNIKNTSDVTAMSIDSSGRVIINNATRPRFEAGFSNDDVVNVGTTNGSDYRITFTQEIVDIGGCWDGAHTFTAPVTGLYMFYGNLYTTWTSNNSRTGTALYVGGSLKYKNWNANWETETTASISMPIYLSATNTVDLRMSLLDSNNTSGTFQFYRNTIYSNFGGYLIG